MSLRLYKDSWISQQNDFPTVTESETRSFNPWKVVQGIHRQMVIVELSRHDDAIWLLMAAPTLLAYPLIFFILVNFNFFIFLKKE